MSDETHRPADHETASQYFQTFIGETFDDDHRPAEIRHIAEVYKNMISVLDIVFAIGQAVETMPLTSEQRYHFDKMRGPLHSLMEGIGQGVTNLAPAKGEADAGS
ncbi:hypothetical protein ABID21_001884 [Pseudorhizobium tarimense]|uniref:Uncharacterized protein n=1 Tax=Pseudorhizobium tarimense TaxID=1079109 RepID=A0ABV2H5F2_9HYPH|nr:hypothetical protein [Pseudorhizobium tarimense]MCJ8518980.1 hypothetical protein [Pseudorhizobium tarimense]